MSRLINLAGNKYGRWEVISRQGADHRNESLWLCRCGCGQTGVITSSSLRSGNSQSCGCLRKEETIKRLSTHGMSETILYNRWRTMINRCENHSHIQYADYGGRGITVCESWHDFSNFFRDMGEPLSFQSIERKDTNGNYEPSNCVWASMEQQQNNRRNNHLVTMNGQTLTLAQWSRKVGLSSALIRHRLKIGMSPEEALFLKK